MSPEPGAPVSSSSTSSGGSRQNCQWAAGQQLPRATFTEDACQPPSPVPVGRGRNPQLLLEAPPPAVSPEPEFSNGAREVGEDPSPRAGEAGPEEEELTEAASLKASSSAALYMTCGQPWAPRPHQRRTAAVWEAPVSEEARLLSRTQPPQPECGGRLPARGPQGCPAPSPLPRDSPPRQRCAIWERI